MAKADADILRRGRGRPPVDRTAELSEVLAKWLDIGAPGWAGIRRAVRSIVPRKETADYKSRREALYDALHDIGLERRLSWAIEAAEARGGAVPDWARDDLAAAEEANRQREAEWAASTERLRPIIAAQAERFNRMVQSSFAGELDKRMESLRREVAHVQRWVRFAEVFDDIFPPDTPASVITRAFAAARQAVLSSVAGVLDVSKTAGK